jgi:hypothetical protein
MGSSEGTFAELARQRCPAVGDVLLVMTGAFQDVDLDAMDARLDELARPLFDVPETARAGRLAEQLSGFALEERSVAGLWLDEVVRMKRGHPLLVAAVGAEIGRRAGLDAGVFSTPSHWYAGVVEGERLWLIDLGEPTADSASPRTLRRHCGHELAFAALSGLAARFTGQDAERLRRRAAHLRDLLSLRPGIEDPGTDLLATLWQGE